MPEKIYAVHEHLQKLKNGGWKDVAWKLQETNMNGEIVTKRGEFVSEFQRALNNVPEHSEHAATRAFFEKVVDKFIFLFLRAICMNTSLLGGAMTSSLCICLEVTQS